MAIHPGAERPFGVVDVKEFKPFQTDDAVKSGKGVLISFEGADVVPSSESVRGVKTHAQAITVCGSAEDASDLLETGAQVCALAGGGLQKNFHLADF